MLLYDFLVNIVCGEYLTMYIIKMFSDGKTYGIMPPPRDVNFLFVQKGDSKHVK